MISLCRFGSCVGNWYFPWPACFHAKTLLTFSLFHFVLQSHTWLLLQISHSFLLLHSNPLWWKGHLFFVSFLEGVVGLHRTVQLQLLWHRGWDINLVTVMLNGLLCKWKKIILLFFETAPKCCISGSSVDYECYPISSKGFLPTVIDIMFIWFKFIHSHLFYFTHS